MLRVSGTLNLGQAPHASLRGVVRSCEQPHAWLESMMYRTSAREPDYLQPSQMTY